MQLSIITPEKTLFSGDASMVTVPGAEGDFGVLDGHMPFVSTLRPGIITVQAAGGTQRMAVAEGFAEVNAERCIILTEEALELNGASATELRGKLSQAETEIAQGDAPGASPRRMAMWRAAADALEQA